MLTGGFCPLLRYIGSDDEKKTRLLRLLSCVATSVLRMRLLHAVMFSKKLRWLTQTKVITVKTQLHVVNARVKRSSQRSFRCLNFNFKKIT